MIKKFTANKGIQPQENFDWIKKYKIDNIKTLKIPKIKKKPENIKNISRNTNMGIYKQRKQDVN